MRERSKSENHNSDKRYDKMERERRFLTWAQGRCEQGYLSVMAMEIRWEDKIIKVSSKAQLIWEWTRLSEGTFSVKIEDKSYKVEAIDGPDSSGNMTIRVEGVERQVKILDERALLLDKMGMSSVDTAADLILCAPMPGKVLSVKVEPGQTVEPGDALLVLEAMKMENVIKSAVGGVVEDVLAKAGMVVEKGELLVAFEA